MCIRDSVLGTGGVLIAPFVDRFLHRQVAERLKRLFVLRLRLEHSAEGDDRFLIGSHLVVGAAEHPIRLRIFRIAVDGLPQVLHLGLVEILRFASIR